MSIIKLIEESDIILNNCASFPSTESEIEKLQEIIDEKEVILNNNDEKIRELESCVKDLKKSLHGITNKYELERRKVAKEKLSLDVIHNYEKFINQISADYEVVKEERNIATQHLACIEGGFADLLNKYERLKTVVIGYQENQEVLIDSFNRYKDAIELMQKRYDDLKLYTSKKLEDANRHLAKVHKKHVNQVTKLKTQVLQSKAKIIELERTIDNLKESQTATPMGITEREETNLQINSSVEENDNDLQLN